ncbi:cadherin domain-containing protein [Dongia sp.]|uniref:cadherin domain-containing protein n=1 Tax=Dongia sp. TaxID=1977262 RepID=UPI0034A0DA21
MQGQEILVKDYFAQATPPDLVIGGHAQLGGALVERLADAGNNHHQQVAENTTTQTDQLAQAATDAIGKVESISGTATVQHTDGTTAPLAGGDPVFLNDVVVTGSDGSVGIVFVDGTTFSLSAGARMTMDEMVFDPASGGGNFVTSVLQGTFIFNTGTIAPNGNMEVNTPVGTIGIRGTTVAARIALEGSDTYIILLADEDGHVGRVIIQNAGGIQEINEANAATTLTSFFIAPSQPVIMPGADVIQYFDDVLQQLRAIQGAAPADNQGGATEEEDTSDQALLDQFDPDSLSTAAGGEEAAAGEEGVELEPVDELSALLGFVPDPLQPVSFFSFNLFGNVGLGSVTFGTAGYYGSGITLDYLDPGVSIFNPPNSPYTILSGGPGNDDIDGSPFPGPLIILGNAGDDVLTGSPSDDQIYGLGGNDLLIAGHGGGDDLIDGGDDTDTVRYASTTLGVTVDLELGFASDTTNVNVIGQDNLVDIENVIGGSGNDTLIGDGASNQLDGSLGSDALTGGDGDDTLYGYLADSSADVEGIAVDPNAGKDAEDGDDSLFGGAGNDTLHGGAGNDVAVFTGNAIDYKIELVTGDGGNYVTVTDLRQGGENEGVDTLYDMERLQFADQTALVANLKSADNYAPGTISLTNSSVAEGIAADGGITIGALAVDDGDINETYGFELLNEETRFEIVNGDLRLRSGQQLNFETELAITLSVKVTDSRGLFYTNELQVTITDVNEAPTAPVDTNAAPNVIAENAAAGSIVDITALSTDEDFGEIVSYSLSDDADGRFVINATTGVVAVAQGAQFDFEGDGAYSIEVTATSSGNLTASQTFVIQLSDVQEVIGALSDADTADNLVAENAAVGTAVGLTARATDPDEGDTISYTLSDNAGGRFAIDTATGVVTVAAALDYETAISHDITVLATSSDGSSSSETFTVSIGNFNDNGVVGPVDADNAANAVAENAAIGTVVGLTAAASDADAGAAISYTLSDNAGGRFAIDTVTGVVTVAAALDYETAISHDITVLATSSDGSSNSETFTVAVGDVNDVPVAVDEMAALVIDSLNTVTNGTNLIANDNIGIDTPGVVDGVGLSNGAIVGVDADGTDIYLKADGTAGSINDKIGTLHVNQDGSWSFTQTVGTNMADAQFTYRLTDANGDSDTATFAVDLHDPTPINYNDLTSTQAVDQQNNIMIILDCSGSMDSSVGGTTRFQLAKDALANMLAQYDQAGDVNVIVVGFSSSSTAMTSWNDVAAALDFINNLDASGGTNYAGGITAATNILNSANLQDQLLNGPTTVYFLSDGEPTSGTSLVSNDTVRNAWDSALINHADRVVAVAMGSDILVTDQDLATVANPNGGGSPANSVIQVNNLSDLSAVLATTRGSASGNVLNGTLTAGNGDGGVAGVTPDKGGDPLTRLASFNYVDPVQGNGTNSLAISWNGVAAVVTGAATGQIISNAGGVVTFATNFGVMTFFFVDSGPRLAGDFTFSAVASTNAEVETFQYTTVDGDGDLDHDGGANLVITVAPDFSLKIVPVETNFQPGSLSAPQTGNGSNNTLSGDAGNNRLDGAGGIDTINGNDGNDWLVGGTGDDALNGGSGNDYLDGGAGNDSMAGGAGNDAYVVNSATDTVSEDAGGGTDTVFASVTYSITDIDVEDLVLTGSANINGTGNDADNHIYGNAGSNTLSAGDGDDYVAGGAGNDTLAGGTGNDFLTGGAGVDTMTGGTGNDVFQNQTVSDNYSVGTNQAVSGINPALYDRITDFDAATDKIVFSALYDGAAGWDAGHLFVEGVDFSTLATGYDGTNATGSAYASGQASLILDSNNNLIYDSNGAAAGYTIVAQIEPASGSPDVTANNVLAA